MSKICNNYKTKKEDKKIYHYCSKQKKEVSYYTDCIGCKKIDEKVIKGLKSYTKLTSKKEMKKQTKVHAKKERTRSSIFTDDLTHCIENKNHIGHIDKHEIFEGKNRQKSIKYNLVVPLCRDCHQTPTIVLKWQKLGRLEFVNRYGEETFINEFQTSKGM